MREMGIQSSTQSSAKIETQKAQRKKETAMKKLFLILLLVPLIGVSQDWHPFPDGQTTLFSSCNIWSDEYLHQNIYPIQIDSIQNDGSAQLFYNVKTPFYMADSWGEYFFNPMGSWIGSSVKVEDGIAKFKPLLYDTIYLDFERNNSEIWRFVTIPTAGYIDAHISGKSILEVVDGIMDSVKYISLEYYNKSDEKIQESKEVLDTMIISKNFGLIKIPPFASFSRFTFFYRAISIDRDGSHFGYKLEINEALASYEVGDTIQWKDMDGKAFMDILSSKVLTNDSVKYTYNRCSAEGVSTDLEKTFYINYLPNQSIITDRAIGFYNCHAFFNEWNGMKEYGIRFYTDFVETDNGLWVYRLNTFDGLDPIMTKVNEVFAFPYIDKAFEYEDAAEIIFYSTNRFGSWGNPINFNCNLGVDLPIKETLNISPNPSNGIFNISSSKEIEELKAYNINGQIVWRTNKLNETQIDLSNLPEGLYLLELKTENQELIHQKVVIKK